MPRLSLGRCVVYVLLLAWSLVCLFPLYWMFIASLKAQDAIINGPRFVPFVDFEPSLEAWRFILFNSSERLLQPLANSLVVSFAATLITVSFAALFTYGTTRFGATKGDGRLYGVVLLSRLLPPAMLVIPLYFMMYHTHLLDTKTALVFTYASINLPVAAWLLRPAFGTRPTQQEEAARLDGAGHVRVLFEILLPMLLGSLASVALLVFVLGWNEYLFAATLTTNEASTLTPWMVGQLSMKEAQVGGEAEEWAHMSAAATLMALPLLLMAGTVQRLLSRMGRAN